MALWLKCLLLLLELSYVLSGVIVVKLDGEEEINTISDIIDSKLDEQDALLHKLNSTFQVALDKQQEQIDGLTEELQQLKKKVLALSDDSAPSWFNQTQLCYQWRPDGVSGQCGAGEPRKLCAYVGQNTQFYRDDTDNRGGGCRMQWGIVSPSAATWFRDVKICYRWYADGNAGQCGGGAPRSMCADVGSFTQEYRDDTDSRGGGCRMSWMLSVPSSSPQWLTNARLCYDWYPDGDGGQCGGGAARKLCATANSWTAYYRDDTDNRGGGCRMSWGLYL